MKAIILSVYVRLKSYFKAISAVPLITASLALVGAFGGAWLGAYLDQHNWEERTNFEAKKAMVDKRIELTERTLLVMNERHKRKKIEDMLNIYRKIGALTVDCYESMQLSNANHADDCPNYLEDRRDDTSKLVSDAIELDGQASAVLFLDALFFGSTTRDMSNTIIGNEGGWWEVSPEAIQELMNSMVLEMKTF